MTLSRFLFPCLLLLLSGVFYAPNATAELVDPAPHFEQKVNWRIGQMRADPALNLVYILNETDDTLLALNTETGNVDTSVVIDDTVRDGTIDFSIDGSTLYISTPNTNRLHAFSTGTLTPQGSTSLPFSVKNFVIGSDGFLYAVSAAASGFQYQVTKLNPVTGAEAESVGNSNISPGYPMVRNPQGTRMFIMSWSGTTTEVAVQNNAAPTIVGTRYGSGSNNKDLAFDDSLNTLYRASGGVYGLGVWNVGTSEYSYWPFDASYGGAVGHVSGAPDVFGASSSAYDGRIRRFNKSTGETLHDYHYTGSESVFESGTILDGRLEVTPNGSVVYGKTDGYDFDAEWYIGLIGVNSLNLPNSAITPGKSHLEVQTSWEIGAMAGDPGRPLSYIVDETNQKLIAFNTDTGIADADIAISDDPENGILSLSPDGNTLYLSTPVTSKIHSFTAGSNLTSTGSVTLPFPVSDFVIGSDGFLYVVENELLTKIDLSTGVVQGAIQDPDYYGAPLLRRNGSGTVIYVMERGLSGGSSAVDKFTIVPDALPSLTGTAFTGKSNDHDLSIDDSRDKLFLTGGGTYGLLIWDQILQIENYWEFDSPYGDAVTQIPALPSVFGASGSEVIREFHKDTGKVLGTYFHEDYDAGFLRGDVLVDGMEMSSNGNVTYGKKFSSSVEQVIGVIGLDTILVPRSGPMVPPNLTATDGELLDRVAVAWDSVPGATQYEVHRRTYDSRPFDTNTPLATVSGTSWEDFTAGSSTVYFYWVRATNSFGKSQFSSFDSGQRFPAAPSLAPESVTASDGTLEGSVALSWTAAERATSYKIFRGTTSDSASSQLVAQGVTETNYSDTEGSGGVTYYYWVKASNSGGESPFSFPDTGFSLPLPKIPGGLTATDGTLVNKVAISWNAADRATSYKVFRNTSNSTASAQEIASAVSETTWDDNTAVTGQDYFYWIKASHGGGDSGFSVAESGSAMDVPPPVAGTSATNAVYENRIELTWNSLAGVSGYKIFRGTTSTYSEAQQVASTVTETSWTDTTAAPGVTYYYWVRATNEAGDSDFGQPDTGFTKVIALAPTGVSASDGTFEGLIQITWSSAANAEQYKLYRSTSPSGPFSLRATLNSSVRSIPDNQADTGIYYYYQITSFTASGGESGPSNTDSGHRALPQASEVSASDGNYQGEVFLTWQSVGESFEYEVLRGLEASGSDAASLGTVTETEFTDISGADGENYYYFVRTIYGPISGSLGNGDSGHSTTGEPYRPDGLIGKRSTGLRGNDIYQAGRGQEVKLVSRRLKTLTWYIQLQNDGETNDQILSRMTRGNRYFKVKLRSLQSGYVTSLALSGSLQTDISGGGSALFQLQAKPGRAAKRKVKKRLFSFSATSRNNASLTDSVRARAQTSKR